MARDRSNGIRYTECFVAFIDILGFEELVKRSVESHEVLDVLLRTLRGILKIPSGTKESYHEDAQGRVIQGRWPVQVRSFSDTVVLFMPTQNGSVSQLLFLIRYLHDRVLEMGFCMRGAVTIGDMYWDSSWSRHGGDDRDRFAVTLGPGLIEAYRLESECAIYPRILISRGLCDYIERERIQGSPLGPDDRRLTDFIRTDDDGLRFLDVLHPYVTRADRESIVSDRRNDTFSISWRSDAPSSYHTIVEHVRRLTSQAHGQSDEKVRAKYEWLRSYADKAGTVLGDSGGG